MARPKHFETVARQAFTSSVLPWGEYSRITGNTLEIIFLERRGTSQVSVLLNTQVALEKRSKETASTQVIDTLLVKDGKQFQGMYRIDDKLEVEYYGSTESYRKLLAMV